MQWNFHVQYNLTVISKTIMAKQGTDEFIENIYLLSDNNILISTSGKSFESGNAESIKKTELGQRLMSNRSKDLWDGEDAALDELLQSSSEDYSMRLIRAAAFTDVQKI